MWLLDVIGHVTTLFATFDFLTALYCNRHEFEVGIALTILELLALNAQKFKMLRNPDHVPFSKNSGVMSGRSWGACVPNLKGWSTYL